MRRYLVVANQTLGGAELQEELRNRAEAGESSFYVLVPNTSAAQHRVVPVGGGHVPAPTVVTTNGGPGSDKEATAEARQRLDQLVAGLIEQGAEAEGHLGSAKPLKGIGEAVADHDFDEVIVSVLPRRVSRWLQADLPHQVERRYGLPVTTLIMTRPAPDQEPGSSDESAPSVGKTILVTGVAALGGFLFGYDTAVINGAVDALVSAYKLGPFMAGFAVSVALLGCAVGAWFAGGLADRFGRVRVMVIAAGLFTVSALGSGLSATEWDFSAWRFVGGMGVGAASVIAPAYIAEISPAGLRGRLGSLQQLAIVIGIFLALLVDYALATKAGSASNELWLGVDAWRWMFLSLLIPAVIYGGLALTIPESPRYLVAKDRIKEAAAVLRRFVAAQPDKKIDEIKESLESDHDFRLADLRGPAVGLLPIVWVGILLSVFQQFVGINVIFYYSSVLWQAVGYGESDALLITVITSVTNIAVTVVAIALIDKVGRKPLLIVGSSGMLLTLGTMAYCFHQAKIVAGLPTLPGHLGTVALIAANLYVVFFGVSWGPVVWVMLGEMFNNRIRASALALAAAAQWLANFAISVSFPKLSAVGLGLTYSIYALFALLSLVFVLRGIRETKGRELEEMA
jgi:MFS transporter, SP family, sugar:H+ symporter